MTIKTYLRKKTDNQNGVVWISFYVNREKINFSTHVSVKIKDWNESRSMIKASDKNADDKNLIIENILARINNVFVKYRLRNKKLTKNTFWRAYNRPDDYPTFWEYIKANKVRINFGNELSTECVHRSVIKKAQEFAPNLHFDDITKEWLDDYYAYLRKTLDNGENTAYKNMSTFRKYVNAAFKSGYMDENPFANWSIKRTRASYTYLTEQELNVWVEAYRKGELEYKYHVTLELFLFMCFSSLHIGDARTLKLEQFTDTSFTYFRIKNRNKKPEPIVVPISENLRKIIRNRVGLRKTGIIFDNLPADQTMNEYLKKIAGWLGMNPEKAKKISHKAGRHTFATYYLRKTKDLTSLKEILGHSELRETLIYAHVLDESKQEGIAFFDDIPL